MTTPPTPTPRTDADLACECIDKIASECRLNPTAYQREAKEKVRQLERELAEALKLLERYHDLVRYQRAELHEADLISDEEYTELLSDSKSVARLENYDGVTSDRDRWRKMAEELADAILRIKNGTPFPNLILGYEPAKKALSRFNAMKEQTK